MRETKNHPLVQKLRYLLQLPRFRDTFIHNSNGDFIVSENCDPDAIIDRLLSACKYNEFERAIGLSFSEEFISELMYAGFYITSDFFNCETLSFDFDPDKLDYFPILSIWTIQTVLFFENMHISKSIARIAKRYELKVNHDFKTTLDKIIEHHGDIWITPPLKETLMRLNEKNYRAKAISFEAYKNGELVAGEIGIATGRIYTSYSGFHDEPSAGSVQIALMLQYLKENKYEFCNFGTDDSEANNLYKRKFGCTCIEREDFMELWRWGRKKPNEFY